MKMKWPSFAALLFAVALSASAQVPTMMSYQGRLAANGSNYNGTARFKFSLVSPDGFTTYWSNDNSVMGGLEPTTNVAVAVSNGLFTVFLGDTTLPGMGAELDPAIFQEHDDAYLRIWVSDGASAFVRLTPDQPLGSVGYAMSAAMAAGVANGAVGVDQLAAGAVTSNKIAVGAVQGAQLASGAVTSNKIDWSTMPAIPDIKGYDESGEFDIPPSATGDNAIALGYNSVADGDYAAVGGGENNMASGTAATAGGGQQNTVNGDFAVVAGGIGNSAAGAGAAVAALPVPSRPVPKPTPHHAVSLLVGTPLHAVERALIEATIERCGGSIPRAARMLELSPSTIYRKLEGWQVPVRRIS